MLQHVKIKFNTLIDLGMSKRWAVKKKSKANLILDEF